MLDMDFGTLPDKDVLANLDLAGQERRAGDLLRQELPELEPLVGACYDFALSVLRGQAGARLGSEGEGLSDFVTRDLLGRLTNDLRAVALCGFNGYPVAAATVASSIFEIAHTVTYISANNDRASEWFNHTKERKPFLRVQELVDECVRDEVSNLTSPPAENLIKDVIRAKSKERMDVYMRLCQIKHGNVIIQGLLGKSFQGDTITIKAHPDDSREGREITAFSLSNAAYLLNMASWSIIRSGSFEENYLATLRERQRELSLRSGEIEQKVIALYSVDSKD